MLETTTIGTIASPAIEHQQEVREMIQIVVSEKNTEIKGYGDRRELSLREGEVTEIVAIARALAKIAEETNNQTKRVLLENRINMEYKLCSGRVFRPRQLEKDNQLIYRNV